MLGIELLNHDKTRTREKKTCKYFGIFDLGSLHHQTSGEERKNKESVSQKNQKATRDKTIWQKPNQEKNTWLVLIVRYSVPFLKWTRQELKQIDQKTRKLMTTNRVLHPRNNVDRLYVSKKEGGRRLARIEDSVDVSI